MLKCIVSHLAMMIQTAGFVMKGEGQRSQRSGWSHRVTCALDIILVLRLIRSDNRNRMGKLIRYVRARVP